MPIKPVKQLIKAKPTIEGAGVHLQRAFGFSKTKTFDSFLLWATFATTTRTTTKTAFSGTFTGASRPLPGGLKSTGCRL